MERRRKSRRLRPEERELWHRVAKTVHPLQGKPPSADRLARPFTDTAEDQAPSGDSSASAKRVKPIAPFRIGEARQETVARYDLASDPDRALGQVPGRMDRKVLGRLTRGKLSPEARIDLHGMTLSEAQPALTRFLMTAHAADRRLVLVITGKGRRGSDEGPIPYRAGAIRQELPLWLSQPPLSGLVLQAVPAHHRHGGSGAYYVYLRRRGGQ
jgi:DNA-nicking Smr family endonuclease